MVSRGGGAPSRASNEVAARVVLCFDSRLLQNILSIKSWAPSSRDFDTLALVHFSACRDHFLLDTLARDIVILVT